MPLAGFHRAAPSSAIQRPRSIKTCLLVIQYWRRQALYGHALAPASDFPWMRTP